MADSAITPTIEDYLLVIYVMQRDGKDVIAARMAEWMNVSPPTVSLTLKRMVRDGWLIIDESQHIILTDEGRVAAAVVLRRHMLSEHLLNRVLGVPWSEVHNEAGRIEHTLSAMTTERMSALLNDPLTCPHGNPLPGNEELLSELTALTTIAPGTTCTIVRIDEEGEENRELLNYLQQNNLLPGSLVMVEDVMPFNQTMTLRQAEHGIVLGLAAARHIHVRLA
jgi:DtxR family transcriptional regulator, Mn-dependent transcriptional regulator